MEYQDIVKKTLPFIKEKGRILDYYLVLNLVSSKNYDKEIIKELLKYRNEDLGFGNGLEPDAQTPSSSVLACNIAISILEEVNNLEKIEIIKGIIKFFLTQYDDKTKSFRFISEDTEKYPSAIWWSEATIKDFGYFNPTPEVVGFLYKYREYIEGFDIENLVDYVLKQIKTDFMSDNSEHSLYSVIKFYNSINEERKKEISEIIDLKTKEIICTDKKLWDEYRPQPHKIINSKNHPLYLEYQDILNENISFLIDKYKKEYILMPEWTWYRYDDVFENKVKYQWSGFITYGVIKVLKEFEQVKGNLI